MTESSSRTEVFIMKLRALSGRFALVGLVLALVAFLALACDDEEDEDATPTPPVAETPTEEATPTPGALGPGAAGIPSNPREVRSLEGILTLDDGLAIFNERPADENRTGVTADTIKLGRHTGITGFIAPYEPGWGTVLEASIKRVNEAGGIHGRMIELITKDDQSLPASAVPVVTELIEGDQVFALFFAVGAPTHSAIHDFHVEQGVPDLFYLDASNLGLEPVTSKWDFNGQNSDILGGITFAEAVALQDPGVKVAVVYADFPASVAGRDGIRAGAEEQGLEIVAEFAHDLTQVDLTSQAQQVAETDADWMIYHGSSIHAVSLIKALRETVGWDGKIAQWGAVTGDPEIEEILDGITMVSPQRGVESDPDLPVWDKLRGLADEEGYTFLSLNGLAFAAFEHLVRGLELAGPDLTREGLVEALELGFDGSWQCSTCRGPTIFGPQDHWSHETFQMYIWNNATKLFDPLGVANHETSEGLGLRGNYLDIDCQPPSAEFPEGTCPWEESS
jgi:ABC-type branched-subunit amino acid transport system substrate-binding protein